MPMMKSQILRYVNSSKAQKSECHENKTITFFVWINSFIIYNRGGSTTDATSKMECFVIIVNGFQPLTTITKCSIVDVATALDPPLLYVMCRMTHFSGWLFCDIFVAFALNQRRDHICIYRFRQHYMLLILNFDAPSFI